MQALVQTGAEIVVSGGTSGSVTLNGVGAGNLLTASCINDTNGTATFSASDNKSDSWSSAVQLGNSRDGLAQILYAANVAGGNTTITITASSSIQFHAIVREWSGSDTSSPLVAHDSYNQSASTGTSQQASSGGINPGSPCICLVVGNSAFNATHSAGSGYTLTDLDAFAIDEYQIFTSSPIAEHGSWTTSRGTDTVSVIAAFKASSGTPAAPGAFIGGGIGTNFGF